MGTVARAPGKRGRRAASRVRRTWRRRVAGLGLAAALATVFLPRPAAVALSGLVLLGFTGLGTVLALRRQRAPLAVLLAGGGTALAGGGGLVVLAGMLAYHEAGPGPAEGIRAGFLVTLLGGLLVLYRNSLRQAGRPTVTPVIRMLLDATIISVALLLALWWGVLAAAFDYADPDPRQLLTLAWGLLDALVMAVGLLLALQYRTAESRMMGIAVAVLAVADLSTLAGMAGPARSVPLLTPALWCLGGVLLAFTGLWPSPGNPGGRGWEAAGGPGRDALLDRREGLATDVATGLAVLAVAGGLPLDLTPDPEPAATVLVGTLVVLLGGRELLNATVRTRLTARLRWQAEHDPLTALPNRAALNRRTGALAGSPAAGGWTVLTMDLDRFKRVNDVLGHLAGDAFLVAVARLLEAHCPAPMLLARTGGDEFVVLCPGDLDDGRRLAATLQRAVRELAAVHAPSLDLSASVGVGRLGDVAESVAALQAAKAVGGGQVLVYAGRVATQRERRLRIERRLRQAIAAEQVRVHVQPVLRLQDGVMAGVETLARWTDEELGPVSPAEFIPVAEHNGLVVALGEQLLRATLAEAVTYRAPQAGITVAVNVSAVQLRSPGFVETVAAALQDTRYQPDRLVVELTEAILVAEDDPALSALGKLAGLGVTLAIDDFGTGYAALSYLRRLPMHMLKMDRSLTVGAGSDPRSAAVVASVLRLAERLGLTVVMEGVEDAEVARACRDVGAHLGQGWHLGVPAPWAEVATRIRPVPPPRAPEPGPVRR
jgi:diguanylate cyclase (GGDEF)-like protein